MTELGTYESSMSTFLVSLVRRTPGASHAVLASLEGIPLAVSDNLPTERAEQLASIGAGLLSIADGAGRCMDAGAPRQVVVEMFGGLLMGAPLTPRVSLTVLAGSDVDRELLGYEVGEFTRQVSPLLEV